MIKIIKKEINLCKKIVERYRRDIEYGNFYIEPLTEQGLLLWDYEDSEYLAGDQCSDTIPLWTISNCLEFLEEKECTYILYFYKKLSFDSRRFKIGKVWHEEGKGWYELSLFDSRKHKNQLFKGETKLEVCLKPVLAVLEEGV